MTEMNNTFILYLSLLVELTFAIGKFSPNIAVLTFPVALVLLVIGQLVFKNDFIDNQVASPSV